MIFESKQTINGKAVWSVDTDKQIVIHITKKGDEQPHYFYTDHIRYHLHYCEEYYPERLQRLVDNGEIYNYLHDLDIKVIDAVCEQAELLMKNNRDWQIANEIGDLYKVGAIGNACREQAKESVFAAMVYV